MFINFPEISPINSEKKYVDNSSKKSLMNNEGILQGILEEISEVISWCAIGTICGWSRKEILNNDFGGNPKKSLEASLEKLLDRIFKKWKLSVEVLGKFMEASLEKN